MKVTQLCKLLDLKCLSEGTDTEITGGFCGDLLSWVMSNAQSQTAWFTVMGNINAIAVASLNDIACIVLCQNSQIQENALQKAIEEKIYVFSTEKSAFECCGILYQNLKNQ